MFARLFVPFGRTSASRRWSNPVRSGCTGMASILGLAIMAVVGLGHAGYAHSNNLVLDAAVSESPVERGQRMYIDVLATNVGSGPVDGASVAFTVPANTTVSRQVIWGANSHACTTGTSTLCNAGATMNLVLGTVPAGVSRLVRVPVNISDSIPAGDLPYQVSTEFSAIHTGSVGPSLASAQTRVVLTKALDVRIAYGHVVVDPLADRRFEVVLANRGMTAIVGHTLDVQLPPDTVLVSAEGGVVMGNAVQWPVQQLAAGRAIRRAFVLRSTSGQPHARIPLTATVNLGGSELARTGVVIPSRADAPLALDVVLASDPVLRDERVMYRVSVTNILPSGGVAMENVRVGIHNPAIGSIRHREALGKGNTESCSTGTSTQCNANSLYTFTLGLIAPGQTRHIDIPVQMASDAGFGRLAHIQFLALAGAGDAGELLMASEVSTVYQARPIQLSWTADEEPMSPGSKLDQRLVVTNTGGVAAPNLDLTLTIPPGLVVEDADGGDVQGDRVVWQLDGLRAGRSDIRRVVMTDAGGVTGDWLKFHGELSEASGAGVLLNRSTASVALADAPNLRLATSVANTFGLRSQRIRYRINAHNANPAIGAPVENAELRFIVPPHLTYRRDTLIGAADGGCSSGTSTGCYSGSLATLELGTLMGGESKSMQLDFEVESGAPFGALDPIRFLFWAPDTNAEWTYSGSASVVAQSNPVHSRLTSSPVPHLSGSVRTYELLVANQGNDAATSAGVELRLPRDVQVVDAGGGTLVGDSVFWLRDQIPAGTAVRFTVHYRDESGSSSRLFPAEASIIAQAGGALRHARSSDAPFTGLQTPVRVVVDPLPPQLPGTSFNYRLTVTNTHDSSGSPLEDVSLRMLVPDGTTVSRTGIVGATNQCTTGTSSTCNGGARLTLSVGILQPGEARIVDVPVHIAAGTPPGVILESRVTASASTSSGVPVPQGVFSTTTVVGELVVMPSDLIFSNGFESP